MNLHTLSNFVLARMLSDAVQGSASKREIQLELRRRAEDLKHAADSTPSLFSDRELKATRKKWRARSSE
jgi:hypothetical protein